MNKLENNLIEAIKNAIKKLYGCDDESLVMIEIPKDPQNGDYSTNIAMRLARIVHKAPNAIAKELLGELETIENLEKIEIAGPGFINFWMNKSSMADVINSIIKADKDYGHNDSGKGKKVLVEYVSANPTGDLHLGHARGAAWGDCITRLMKASGYDVLREYYVNDAGNQIKNLGLSLFSRYADNFDLSIPMPEDGYYGKDVIQVARHIADTDGDKWLNADESNRIDYFEKEGTKLELDKIKRDLDYFRVSFDSWISEKSLYQEGRVKKCLDTMIDKGLTYEEDGALWFKSSKYGDDKDRVLIKKDGSYTYLTPDIANHVYKFERGYETLVNLWGADHHGYIPRMKAAIDAMGYNGDNLLVDIIQMVRLVEDGKEVKMSKRTGNAVTIRELCDDIGVDATRYFFVARAVDTHLDFDLGLARKKTNENPVFYVQYAHARICSILRQADRFIPVEKYDLLTDPKEIELLKYLNEFTNVVIDASKNRAPNKICNYVQKLAADFHSFYAVCKVNDPDNPELTNQRLGLLEAARITLANALDLIGIEAPEKM